MRVLCLLLAGTALALRAGEGPELIVDVDVNDEVFCRPEPLTEADIAALVKDLQAHGTQVLLVRMGFLGYLPYRMHQALNFEKTAGGMAILQRLRERLDGKDVAPFVAP